MDKPTKKQAIQDAAGDIVRGILNKLAMQNTDGEGRYLRKDRTNERIVSQVVPLLAREPTKYERGILRELIQTERLQRNRDTTAHWKDLAAATGKQTRTYKAEAFVEERDQYGNKRKYIYRTAGMATVTEESLRARHKQDQIDGMGDPPERGSEQYIHAKGGKGPQPDSVWTLSRIWTKDFHPE